MNDYEIQQEVDLLKGKIKQHMHYSILLENTDMPTQDEEKLSMLYRMFLETDSSPREIETYVVTIMLVQTALDAHDLISTEKPLDNAEEKSRQLTILGGDYYSGLYYLLLSELKEIGLIKEISKSIQLVNEHKMFLYKSRLTLEDTVENLRVLETSLLSGVAKYFNQHEWASFFEEYFLLKRLLTEKRLYLQSQSGSDLAERDKQQIKMPAVFQERKQQFDSYIERAVKAVEKRFAEHTAFKSIQDGWIWSVFTETGLFNQKLAEEG